MLGVDHDKIILLSAHFAIIPILVQIVVAVLEINDIVLYFIAVL